jgi:hypothetical protein
MLARGPPPRTSRPGGGHAEERATVGLKHEEEPLHVIEAAHFVHSDARAAEEGAPLQ